jgi:hypothetical protein
MESALYVLDSAKWIAISAIGGRAPEGWMSRCGACLRFAIIYNYNRDLLPPWFYKLWGTTEVLSVTLPMIGSLLLKLADKLHQD